MSASPKQIRILKLALSAEVSGDRNIKCINYWLDKYNEVTSSATTYDAELWGFPKDWMIEERIEIAERGGCNWPKEII